MQREEIPFLVFDFMLTYLWAFDKNLIDCWNIVISNQPILINL